MSKLCPLIYTNSDCTSGWGYRVVATHAALSISHPREGYLMGGEEIAQPPVPQSQDGGSADLAGASAPKRAKRVSFNPEVVCYGADHYFEAQKLTDHPAAGSSRKMGNEPFVRGDETFETAYSMESFNRDIEKDNRRTEALHKSFAQAAGEAESLVGRAGEARSIRNNVRQTSAETSYHESAPRHHNMLPSPKMDNVERPRQRLYTKQRRVGVVQHPPTARSNVGHNMLESRATRPFNTNSLPRTAPSQEEAEVVNPSTSMTANNNNCSKAKTAMNPRHCANMGIKVRQGGAVRLNADQRSPTGDGKFVMPVASASDEQQERKISPPSKRPSLTELFANVDEEAALTAQHHQTAAMSEEAESRADDVTAAASAEAATAADDLSTAIGSAEVASAAVFSTTAVAEATTSWSAGGGSLSVGDIPVLRGSVFDLLDAESIRVRSKENQFQMRVGTESLMSAKRLMESLPLVPELGRLDLEKNVSRKLKLKDDFCMLEYTKKGSGWRGVLFQRPSVHSIKLTGWNDKSGREINNFLSLCRQAAIYKLIDWCEKAGEGPPTEICFAEDSFWPQFRTRKDCRRGWRALIIRKLDETFELGIQDQTHHKYARVAPRSPTVRIDAPMNDMIRAILINGKIFSMAPDDDDTLSRRRVHVKIDGRKNSQAVLCNGGDDNDNNTPTPTPTSSSSNSTRGSPSPSPPPVDLVVKMSPDRKGQTKKVVRARPMKQRSPGLVTESFVF